MDFSFICLYITELIFIVFIVSFKYTIIVLTLPIVTSTIENQLLHKADDEMWK